MMILTNCLSRTDDEGSLKVARNLIGRLKKANPEICVVSCAAEANGCDVHLPANKLLLNHRLAAFLHKRCEPVVYLPAFARMLPTALRIWMLSRYTQQPIWALLVMRSPMGRMARFLLKRSKANVLVLSAAARKEYSEVMGEERVAYLKTGVDVNRFVPVDAQAKQELRKKYGIPLDKRVVLHVGHMTRGRNVLELLKLDEAFHGVLAVSASTKAQQDEAVRAQLEEMPNLTIIDEYVPRIEELYQLADVYLFPVEECCSCIDVPLSALEAASCGLPVVTTAYGELAELVGKPGFALLDSMEETRLNALLHQACETGESGRAAVMEYDWNLSVEELSRLVGTAKKTSRGVNE